jgi:hypothetical protein
MHVHDPIFFGMVNDRLSASGEYLGSNKVRLT